MTMRSFSGENNYTDNLKPAINRAISRCSDSNRMQRQKEPQQVSSVDSPSKAQSVPKINEMEISYYSLYGQFPKRF